MNEGDLDADRMNHSRDEEDKGKPVAPYRVSLTDKLFDQLHVLDESEDLMILGEMIIQSLDEDGYFTQSLESIVEDLDLFDHIKISMDDFGTGYSSLSYFGNLDLDWLKLDRTFLLKAMENYRSRNIYSSIVKMVHATGVKVVSEGVETQEQFAYINELNIDEIQGYLIGKPGDADSMTNLLFPGLNKKYSS